MSCWFQVFSSCAFVLVVYYLYFKLVAAKYWKKRNVFNLEPVFVLGNDWRAILFEGTGFSLEGRYRRWKEKKLVGYWSFITPSLLVTDLDLIRKFLVRDFHYFMDRPLSVNEEIDPLAGHLINLKGSKWKNMRVKLTPTFTSGKMKMMFQTLVDCGVHLQKILATPAEREETLEMREVFARFTTDTIASCAFGIDTNCLDNPGSEFRFYGKKIFEPGFRVIANILFVRFFPRLRDFLRVRSISKDISDFFLKVVKDTMEYRERNGVKRNDFMELLIQLKNKGKVDDSEDSNPSVPEQKFTVNQAAAQAFVFFAAGFETSSTTLSFAIYELALNPDTQALLQREIDSGLRKTDGKITYEGIMEMEYLDWVIQETLRKYPPVPLIGRKCTKEYKIPEMGVTLEEGTRVFISVMGIQRDPLYFPDPEKFDPTRFSPEEKAKRDRLTSLAFGEGPRNCIGNRFGLLQTKVGLVSLLSEYDVEVSKETPIPLEFNRRSFLLTPIGGIPLKITKRKNKPVNLLG